ncbi:MAG: hypothetical protein JO112_00520, partial [Planctomycetes bacterium]|nr:hypothetical protein [Planctomycetota bacterium]
DLFRSSPRNVPDNVCRVLNIRAHGIILTGGDLFFNGVDMDGAMNYQLDVRHIKLPGCKEAVTLVTTEVLSLACTPGPALPPAGVPAPPAASPVP